MIFCSKMIVLFRKIIFKYVKRQDFSGRDFYELLKNKYLNYASLSHVTYVSLLQYFSLRERDLFIKGEYHRVYQILHFLEYDDELKKVLK